MPITERTLRKWRKESLRELVKINGQWADAPVGEEREKTSRILRMTQELLDQHLMRKETK
jgi:hypothetical protein